MVMAWQLWKMSISVRDTYWTTSGQETWFWGLALNTGEKTPGKKNEH